MYQTVRRAGKRYVISKLNGTTSNNVCQENRYKNNQLRHSNKEEISRTSKDFILKSFYFSERPATQRSVSKFLTESSRHHCGRILPSHFLHTLSNATLLKPDEVESSLKEQHVPYEKGYTGFLVTSHCCPSDSKQTFVDLRTGHSTCRSCGSKLEWKDFLAQHKAEGFELEHPEENETTIIHFAPKTNEQWLNSQAIDKDSNMFCDVLEMNTYLTYNVRKTDDDKLIFPYYDISKENLVQYVVFDPDSKQTVKIQSDEISPSSLFGWTTIDKKNRTLVLTSSELDCMSIWQASGLPSLAISSLCNALPPDMLPFLEQFDKIILWFPDTYRDQENLQNFARKLNLQRCWKVSSDKTAFNLLSQNGANAVTASIHSSKHMTHDHILTFKDLRLELYNELNNAKKNAGIPFTRFPALNEYLKGHRRGELTVFTGATGSGKTTFLSELSLDLCLQGVKTLWGSFEIKNLRLLNTLMHQYAGFAIQNHMERYMEWSEKFEDLPMYFMSYYGAQDLRDVINTIEYAVYTLDIEHVVIDNLQFMTSVQGSTDDRFLAMDRAVAAFRRCASDHNIHVTVVVHPRKENDGGSLQTASIYGSAKASQEADNVLILQSSDERSMQITKNRYCGSIGVLPLSFHPESLCLSGFHRNLDTNEEILPALRIRRPVSNVKVYRNKEK